MHDDLRHELVLVAARVADVGEVVCSGWTVKILWFRIVLHVVSFGFVCSLRSRAKKLFFNCPSYTASGVVKKKILPSPDRVGLNVFHGAGHNPFACLIVARDVDSD